MPGAGLTSGVGAGGGGGGWVGACVRVRALARACVYGVCGVSQAIGAGYHGYPMEKIEKRHKTQTQK